MTLVSKVTVSLMVSPMLLPPAVNAVTGATASNVGGVAVTFNVTTLE